MEADFSGYATKNGLKCSDGRIIHAGAFKGNDGKKVPLVWQHQYNEPSNVLGHALLENRPDGVYAYGYFNDSDVAKHARTMVQHGDITALSIYANKLVQQGSNVLHGEIREVSLVLSGANPGAYIDNVNLQHGDTIETLDDEAVIYTGLELEHADTAPTNEGAPVAETTDNRTIQDVFDTLTDEQKDVVYFMIGTALEEAGATAQHDDMDDEESFQHDDREDNMTRNVFDQSDATPSGQTLSHAEVRAIVSDAQKCGSLREAFLAHAQEYGIENIDILFPDAKTVTPTPEMISRRMEWVGQVISGTHHSPFARIKSTAADITADEARAKGYVKGNLKKDEVIKLLKRVTTPTTIYKKQKLDRDDIIDITDLDVVAWLKAEMRLMLDEELARAVLIGDGREADDEDKINEEHIRPIAKDDEMYAHRVHVENTPDFDLVEAVLRSRSAYKGTGTPTFFTTDTVLTNMLLQKDKMGRRLYNTETELASALRVSKIVPVEVLEDEPEIVGIIVNLADYTVGADRGGAVSMFDDFDIDYNQYKYLIETRCSGALTKPKSAIILTTGPGTGTGSGTGTGTGSGSGTGTGTGTTTGSGSGTGTGTGTGTTTP